MGPTAYRFCRLAIPAALVLGLGGAASAATTHAPPHRAASTADAALVRSVQRALDKQGAAISVDGHAGPMTERALLNYQSAHHLGLTGKIDAATRKSLGVG
jgi:peptidoglycan hydrolase-like protein with peptidoglycan-binding domain